jgi:membrane-bound metal-dependent hydrolase YbcI (DUF457 family)
MAGIGHIGLGFMAKPLAPKAPLWLLLITTEAIDLLWMLFYFTKFDQSSGSPWSHGLFMSAIWSIIAMLLVFLILRDRRSAIVVGILVFSHWVIDFITHPMGAIFGGKPLSPDLPLFFGSSPKVGLGLYNHSYTLAVATDLGLLILGIILYIRYRVKLSREKALTI